MRAHSLSAVAANNRQLQDLDICKDEALRPFFLDGIITLQELVVAAAKIGVEYQRPIRPRLRLGAFLVAGRQLSFEMTDKFLSRWENIFFLFSCNAANRLHGGRAVHYRDEIEIPGWPDRIVLPKGPDDDSPMNDISQL